MDFGYFFNRRDVAALKGKTLTEVRGMEEGSRAITFVCSDGTAYKMYHQQDDNEIVYVSDVKLLAGFTPPPDCLRDNPYTEDDPEEREEWALNVIRNDAVTRLPGAEITFAERIILDRELMLWSRRKSKPHEDMRGVQRTIFILANPNVALAVVWYGMSDDDRNSTEVDFVQTAGKGVQKEVQT